MIEQRISTSTLPNGPDYKPTSPARAILTLSTRALTQLTLDLAAEYAAAGLDTVEIRLSPFGGDDESLRKIRSAFAFLQTFHERGIHVTLGQSGNIGQTALALGYIDAYSVGIGMLEKVNHSQVVARHRREPGKDQGGAAAGIYLPRLAATVPTAAAKDLLHTPISAPASDAVSANAATASQGRSTTAAVITSTPEPLKSLRYSHVPNLGEVQWKTTDSPKPSNSATA